MTVYVATVRAVVVYKHRYAVVYDTLTQERVKERVGPQSWASISSATSAGRERAKAAEAVTADQESVRMSSAFQVESLPVKRDTKARKNRPLAKGVIF